jgi:hypothetical protein
MRTFIPSLLSPIAIHTENLKVVLRVAVELQPPDDIDRFGVSLSMLLALAVDMVESQEVYLAFATTGTLAPVLSKYSQPSPLIDLISTSTRSITERTASNEALAGSCADEWYHFPMMITPVVLGRIFRIYSMGSPKSMSFCHLVPLFRWSDCRRNCITSEEECNPRREPLGAPPLVRVSKQLAFDAELCYTPPGSS